MKRHKIHVYSLALFIFCSGCLNGTNNPDGTFDFCRASTFKSEDELKLLSLKKAWERESLFRYGVTDECMNDYDCISKKYRNFPVRVNVTLRTVDCKRWATNARQPGWVTECVDLYVSYNDEDFVRVLKDSGITLNSDQRLIRDAGSYNGYGQSQGLSFDRCGNFLSEADLGNKKMGAQYNTLNSATFASLNAYGTPTPSPRNQMNALPRRHSPRLTLAMT